MVNKKALRNVVRYIGRRLGDRIIDLVGLGLAAVGLVIAYTAASQTINVIVPVPPALLPSDFLGLVWDLATKCLDLCFD